MLFCCFWIMTSFATGSWHRSRLAVGLIEWWPERRFGLHGQDQPALQRYQRVRQPAQEDSETWEQPDLFFFAVFFVATCHLASNFVLCRFGDVPTVYQRVRWSTFMSISLNRWKVMILMVFSEHFSTLYSSNYLKTHLDGHRAYIWAQRAVMHRMGHGLWINGYEDKTRTWWA